MKAWKQVIVFAKCQNVKIHIALVQIWISWALFNPLTMGGSETTSFLAFYNFYKKRKWHLLCFLFLQEDQSGLWWSNNKNMDSKCAFKYDYKM